MLSVKCDTDEAVALSTISEFGAAASGCKPLQPVRIDLGKSIATKMPSEWQ
jgi:hypothetical protein